MTTSRDWLWWIILALVMLTVAWLTLPADAAECLSSAAAVREAHGIKTWSGISHHVAGHDGKKCYYAKARPRSEVAATAGQKAVSRRPRETGGSLPPAPVSHTAFTTPSVENEISFVIIEGMVREILWRKGLHGRLKEWFSVYDKADCIPSDSVQTFNERWGIAFSARKIRAFSEFRSNSVERL